ncbi:MAG: phosphate acetyltransferase [Hyphomicrobiales bacterium]|nr:phosphate acetyltransferase [Hyphomicrobiales bacterium]
MTRPDRPRMLYVAPASSDFEVAAISFGLVEALRAVGLDTAWVKPIADPGVTPDRDRSVGFARRLFGFDTPDPMSLTEAEDLVRADRVDSLLEDIVALCEEVAEGQDVVVVEGVPPSDLHPLVVDLEPAIARSLRADVVPVVAGVGGDVDAIAHAIADVVHRMGGRDVCAGVVVARLAEDRVESLRRTALAAPLLAVLQEDPVLAAPRLTDIVAELGFTVAHPGALAEARVRDVVVAARDPEHLVERLTPGTLVVTPGDRHDIVATTALAGAGGMPIAGLLLTCGARPAASLTAFLKPRWGDLPVLETELQTFEAAMRLGEFDRGVRHDDVVRMEHLIAHACDNIDLAELGAPSKRASGDAMPPPAFRHELIRAARAADRRIVLPEGDEPRTLAAAADCVRRKIARCVLLGRPETIAEVATRHGVALPDGLEILDPDAIRETYVEPMVALRRSKGLTADQARAQLEDTVVLGTMMLAEGHVDGLVSGAVHTTASTVRPALQLIKTRPGETLVSSVFFMLMPDRVLVYGDCAINPDPTADELAEIAIQSAESAAAFGVEPKVAMLSYSTGASGAGGDVEKVRDAVAKVRALRPDLIVDGPIQYDAATVESVARQKAPDSPVAGHASVFVFPDLNTGNTTYKAVQRSANVVSIGPMLQGLRKPVNDLSRGALVDDIVYTIAITAIQAAADPTDRDAAQEAAAAE